MDQQLLLKLQEYIGQGEKLVPEGGLEFSGYNAKMQSQYLLWRKNCLDVLLKAGEKAAPMREKITKDENGAYFYQNSAQVIVDALKQTLPFFENDVKKNSQPAAVPVKPATEAKETKMEPVKAQSKDIPQPLGKTEAKPATPRPAPAPAEVPQAVTETSQKEVFVLSSSKSDLQSQLTSFLKEIGIDGIVFQRGSGIDSIVLFLETHPNTKYAYYLFNAEDMSNAMFELGYLMGKVGSGRVCCIHKQADAPPKGLPGITYKEIIVKLEEISFGLIKELKAAGYTVTI
jgi:predicted nucleotide-binding protein